MHSKLKAMSMQPFKTLKPLATSLSSSYLNEYTKWIMTINLMNFDEVKLIMKQLGLVSKIIF